jgi:hypothetical protein
MVDYNLANKNHIHSLVAKLWFNNEKGMLWILIMQFMSTSKPWLSQLIFEIQHFIPKNFIFTSIYIYLVHTHTHTHIGEHQLLGHLWKFWSHKKLKLNRFSIFWSNVFNVWFQKRFFFP